MSDCTGSDCCSFVPKLRCPKKPASKVDGEAQARLAQKKAADDAQEMCRVCGAWIDEGQETRHFGCMHHITNRRKIQPVLVNGGVLMPQKLVNGRQMVNPDWPVGSSRKCDPNEFNQPAGSFEIREKKFPIPFPTVLAGMLEARLCRPLGIDAFPHGCLGPVAIAERERIRAERIAELEAQLAADIAAAALREKNKPPECNVPVCTSVNNSANSNNNNNDAVTDDATTADVGVTSNQSGVSFVTNHNRIKHAAGLKQLLSYQAVAANAKRMMNQGIEMHVCPHPLRCETATAVVSADTQLQTAAAQLSSTKVVKMA